MKKIVRSHSKGQPPGLSLTKSFLSIYHDNIRHNLLNKNCKIMVQNTNVHRGRSQRRNNKRTLN